MPKIKKSKETQIVFLLQMLQIYLSFRNYLNFVVKLEIDILWTGIWSGASTGGFKLVMSFWENSCVTFIEFNDQFINHHKTIVEQICLKAQTGLV